MMATINVNEDPLAVTRHHAVQRLAVLLAVLGWTALVLQAWISVTRHIALGNGAAYGVMMYTGYFTILTNALCAAVATAVALGARVRPALQALRRPAFITAAAVSILLVGVIYHLLLRAIHHPVGLEYACNVALHYLVPPLFVVFWWLAVPRGVLVWRDLWLAFAFPAAYAVYVLARGEIAGVYPYPFFDVTKLGYPDVLRNAVSLSGVFVATGLTMLALKRSSTKR
jgi:uncharacterized membrane protein